MLLFFICHIYVYSIFVYVCVSRVCLCGRACTRACVCVCVFEYVCVYVCVGFVCVIVFLFFFVCVRDCGCVRLYACVFDLFLQLI